MFPTLNDLLDYFFGVRLPVVIQTLGFFVALSFVASYQVFKLEFKRYEANCKILAFTKTVFAGRESFFASLVINMLLGFTLGYKAGGAFFESQSFRADPQRYIFSLHGIWLAGILGAAAFALWIYRDQKHELKIIPAQPVEKIMHPYQLMGTIVVSVGIAGVIGSKLFDLIEHISVFKYDPVRALFRTAGYNYYGGLIFGALTYLYIGHRHGMKLVHLADIGSPGMMLAYGVGRIGCQLAGDGDWGITNLHPKPPVLSWLPDWMWSFRFPHNIINAGVPIPGCNGDFCYQLVAGVYPTPFYEVVLCIGLFLLMWFTRKRIVTPGTMFCLYLLLNGGERLMIECIRINRRYSFLGLNMTQAQIIAALMVMGGVAGFVYLIFVKQTKRKLKAVS